jgi:hypothetical protein
LAKLIHGEMGLAEPEWQRTVRQQLIQGSRQCSKCCDGFNTVDLDC